jgi:hypothetical protein
MMPPSDDPREIDHTTSLIDSREILIRHLNSDLAGELQTIIM